MAEHALTFDLSHVRTAKPVPTLAEHALISGGDPHCADHHHEEPEFQNVKSWNNRLCDASDTLVCHVSPQVDASWLPIPKHLGKDRSFNSLVNQEIWDKPEIFGGFVPQPEQSGILASFFHGFDEFLHGRVVRIFAQQNLRTGQRTAGLAGIV